MKKKLNVTDNYTKQVLRADYVDSLIRVYALLMHQQVERELECLIHEHAYRYCVAQGEKPDPVDVADSYLNRLRADLENNEIALVHFKEIMDRLIADSDEMIAMDKVTKTK